MDFAGVVSVPFFLSLDFERTHSLPDAVAAVAIVAVAVRNSCVSVALLMDSSATACLSAAVAVAKFASAFACCCYLSNSAAFACPPLMLVVVPYPSDACVLGWILISLNSLAKNVLNASHVLSAVYF